MSQTFDSPKELVEFDSDRTDAAQQVRNTLASRIAVDKCYAEGVQWLSDIDAGRSIIQNGTAIKRQLVNWNPDSKALRAQANYVTGFLIECASATFVEKLEVEGKCPPRRYDVTAQRNAQIAEDIATAFIEGSGLVNVARNAQFRRCVCGTYGIGLRHRIAPRTLSIDGKDTESADQTIEAYEFEPTRLILDPHIQNTDLLRHEEVGYSDVWTVHKIRRELGDKVLNGIHEDDLCTVGELMPAHMEMHRISDGRLYGEYARYSRTKGAVIKQWHFKDASGRFSRMYVMVCLPKEKEPIVANFDNPESPYGGKQLPFVLLSAHRRTDVMWSISDVSMLKDDQDKINLVETLKIRSLRAGAGSGKWLVDINSMDGKQVSDFEHWFTNQEGGIIPYRGPKSQYEKFNAPQLVQQPQLPPFIQDMIDRQQDDMRRKVFRARVNEGELKTHTPDASYRRAIEEAGRVLGIRVVEDLSRYREFILMGCGTVLKLAKEQSPSILAMLSDNGFTDQDFAAMYDMDPYSKSYDITVRESSVRYTSTDTKIENIDRASQLQQISAIDARIAKAQYDTPLTPADADMVRAADNAVMDIMAGAVWAPLPLGEYSPVFVQRFRSALLDRSVKGDPGAQQRLAAAVQSQTMMQVQEQMLAEGGGAQPAGGEAAPTTDQLGAEGEQAATEAALMDIMNSLSGQSPGVPAAA